MIYLTSRTNIIGLTVSAVLVMFTVLLGIGTLPVVVATALLGYAGGALLTVGVQRPTQQIESDITAEQIQLALDNISDIQRKSTLDPHVDRALTQTISALREVTQTISALREVTQTISALREVTSTDWDDLPMHPTRYDVRNFVTSDIPDLLSRYLATSRRSDPEVYTPVVEFLTFVTDYAHGITEETSSARMQQLENETIALRLKYGYQQLT